MDKFTTLISFAKRRGFVYPSSEIYGGFAAVYDYGPYGAKNIKDYWWKWYVQWREDIVGLDAAIFMNPQVWVASGHVSGFSDPLIECKNCHSRQRVDKMLSDIGVVADEKQSIEEINKLVEENKDKLVCPECGAKNFAPARKFNLLVKSNLGNFTEDWSKDPVYLRGETCQGIYVDYKSVLDSVRVKIPFGIAQIGKAFRNEITARKFIFRTREFEQMEMQYFTAPDDEMNQYEKMREDRLKFFLSLGVKPENLKWHKHENLVFYAKEAYDVEYNFPWGFDELEGVHARGDYDLTQHAKYSGADLSYNDPQTGKKYVPHIIESSVGVGRIFLMLLSEAYTEEKVDDDVRVVLKIKKSLAPVKVAVFPLLKNKPELIEVARKIFDELKLNFVAEYDDNGNVGKRYRRQDEIGTPYCITVDFDTLTDGTVTVRDRDSMKQERVAVSGLSAYLRENLK